MPDILVVKNASGVVCAGKCQLVGYIITCTATSGGQAIFDDSVDGSGTQLVSVRATAYAPVSVYLKEPFFPLFSTGMYLTLAANMSATLWLRQL
jgi:hypothetical protein